MPPQAVPANLSYLIKFSTNLFKLLIDTFIAYNIAAPAHTTNEDDDDKPADWGKLPLTNNYIPCYNYFISLVSTAA